MTRELWLEKMIASLRPRFEAAGAPIPDGVRVTCSWPHGGARKTIGQCWTPEGRAPEIFISPELDDVARVADVLLHELVHAAVGCDAGHGPAFKRVAVALGLTGRMTATVASPELTEDLRALAAEIGEYGHTAIEITAANSGRKKQTTRMIKAECQAFAEIATIYGATVAVMSDDVLPATKDEPAERVVVVRYIGPANADAEIEGAGFRFGAKALGSRVVSLDGTRLTARLIFTEPA